MPGDYVKWVSEHGKTHVGICIRFVPAGEMPTLPSETGGRRSRFRKSPSRDARVIVRHVVTRLYYAPREASVQMATDAEAKLAMIRCRDCENDAPGAVRCRECAELHRVKNNSAGNELRAACGIAAKRCGNCGEERHNVRTCPSKGRAA